MTRSTDLAVLTQPDGVSRKGTSNGTTVTDAKMRRISAGAFPKYVPEI